MTDAELLKRYEAALLAIIHMDVYTRDGEAPAHEVMREIAVKAVKPSGPMTVLDTLYREVRRKSTPDMFKRVTYFNRR